MKNPDKITREAFERLTDEEQAEVVNELKKSLGGHEIDLKLYCPKEVREWWEGKAREMVDGGVTSVQLLLSHFFLCVIKNSLDNSVQDFNERVGIALSILKGDISISYKTSDTTNMEEEPNEDISKKTFH